MELRHLRYAIAVVDHGSMLRAAGQLHISQPPLTTQIKQLEAELGVALFERSTRGVAPTPAGRAFVDEARAILAHVERARGVAQRAARGESGTLSIGFVSIADFGLLPLALKRFRDAYPAVDVQLHELTTDAQVDALAAERIDVGLALAPVADAGLRFEEVAREALLLAVPDEHAATRGLERIALRRVAGEPFVMVPRRHAPGLHDAIVALCRASGFVPQVSQEARQMQTVVSLVAGGFGVALVPASMRNLQRAGVRHLALTGRGATVTLGCLHRASPVPMPVKHFVAAVRAAAAG